MSILTFQPSHPPPFRTSLYESPHILPITSPLFRTSLYERPHILAFTLLLFPTSLYGPPHSSLHTPLFPTSLYGHLHILAFTLPPKSLPSLPSLHFHLLRMPTATLGEVVCPQGQWMIPFSILHALILWLFDDIILCPREVLVVSLER